MTIIACSFGAPEGETEELLTLARRLSVSAGAGLRWLVVGPAQAPAIEQHASAFGIPAVDRIQDARLETLAPDASVEALAQYCASRPPKALLMIQTFDARLLAPRIAGRLDVSVLMNALEVEAAGDTLRVTASSHGGDTRAVYELAGDGPHIIGVMPNATTPEPAAGPAPGIESVAVELNAVEERVRVVERTPEQGPRLEDAQVIVGGGRGLGAPENFHLIEELADALGGQPAASRPIVDDGWADSSRQIGLTGKITRPALYIAAGISGASQHMAGCAAAKTIVAINRDPDAPIFRHARYGIVGDCLDVLSELTRAARER